ncbi:hypothetical protein FRC08_003079 [Ceratobasidium sp. 394]|nr:hypothetical protein FRC08_003079 [Ceratobasidium sp. 394]
MTHLLPGNLSKPHQTKLAESGDISLGPGPLNKGTGDGQDVSLFLDNPDAVKDGTEQIPEGPKTEDPASGGDSQAQQEEKTSPTRYTEGPRLGYDDYGQELGKDARFWKAYLKESKVWDADMVDGWNNSLDLILIFAALFSAISTAFVIESSKTLQPDPTETSAQTLSLISQTLLAMANTQPGSAFNFTPPEPSPFVAPTSAVWVNTLWFLSLSLSVAVSLIAMLGKGWARGYVAELTGMPYQQARTRQQRWEALQKWRMPEVVMLLPSLLHLALLLFAVGLTIQLWNIHLGTAIPVLVVTFIAIGAYTVSTILPLFHNHCPYNTPVSKLLLILQTYVSNLISPLISAYQHFAFRTRGSRGSGQAASDPELAQSVQDATLQEYDSDLMDDLSGRALSWLIINYGDIRSLDIALQAIAGADMQRLPVDVLVECNAPDLLLQRLGNCCATRQKTGKYFLKRSDLFEAATLYGRAISAMIQNGNDTPLDLDLSDRDLVRLQMQCVINYGLDSPTFSPNKVAFTLASLAIVGVENWLVRRSAWVAWTVQLLDSHFDDQITFEDPALLALLKATTYVMTDFDSVETLLPLALALAALGDKTASQAQGLIGIALTCFALVRVKHDTVDDILRQPDDD